MTGTSGYTRLMVDDAHGRAFSRDLVHWFAGAARDLPWRRRPTPYGVWVSEVMLQQTQVATVVPYYHRWMGRLPTVAALAAADEDDVLTLWQGLGYYRRARQLLAGARVVMDAHGGELPRDPAALRSIPGIGPYTAGAIASIAHGVPAPLVDGNVVRVLCRQFGLAGDPTRAPLARALWDLAADLVPDDAPSAFNQGLMELGAMVCTPRQPACSSCPVAGPCIARQTDRVDQLPELPKRRPTVATTMAAAVVRGAGGVWLTKIAADAPRWAGMWQFPTVTATDDEGPDDAARRAAREALGQEATVVGSLPSVKHAVTHHRITLHVRACRPERSPRATAKRRLVALDDLDAYALPAAQRRIATALRREGDA